ncbi:MAG: hypothetical protein ACKVS7_08460 [Gemmatimonadaceae bacterium]
MSRFFSVLAVASAVLAPQVTIGAQSKTEVRIFHGRLKDSGFAEANRSRGIEQGGREARFSLDVGDQLCVVVSNAHPFYYGYSLEAAVDTSSYALPDLALFTKFIETVKDYNALQTMGTLPQAIEVPENPRDSLAGFVLQLRRDLDSANVLLRASDDPGTERNMTDAGIGFRRVVPQLKGLSSKQGRFNDAKLAENHTTWMAALSRWAGTDETKLADATLLSAATLFSRAARDAITSVVNDSSSAAVRICKPVQKGVNTYQLQIAKRGEIGTRDTFKKDDATAIKLVVESKFERKAVAVEPVTLVISAKNVPGFAVRSDTLVSVEHENRTVARPGAVLTFTPWAFGRREQWALGVAAGAGFSSKDVVSDLLFGVTLDFRGLVRLGAGYGFSSQPESVKGATVGQPIPASLGELDKAIVNGKLNQGALYVLLSLPGLSLGK